MGGGGVVGGVAPIDQLVGEPTVGPHTPGSGTEVKYRSLIMACQRGSDICQRRK